MVNGSSSQHVCDSHTSTEPAWTILIATLGRRSAQLERLLDGLLPQVEKAAGTVTVEALWNNAERPVGQVRQDLLEHATSRYVSFVDDDDQVPARYVSRILPLLDGVDYIGFKVAIPDGQFAGIARHSLKCGGWGEDQAGYYRHVSHLNPVRRELALRVSFAGQHEHYGEDYAWAHQMRPHVQTERFIDDVLYYYSPTGELHEPGLRVRMVQQMSGRRYGPAGDLTDWPAPGEIFEVTKAEAADLCRTSPAANPPIAVLAPPEPPGDTGTYARLAVTSPYFSWHPASSECFT